MREPVFWAISASVGVINPLSYQQKHKQKFYGIAQKDCYSNVRVKINI